MSRGESSGGGQSCLGYLFEWSDSNSNINHPPKMLSLIPPYAIDDHNTNHPLNLNPITLSSPKPPSSISLINSPSSNNTNTSSYKYISPSSTSTFRKLLNCKFIFPSISFHFSYFTYIYTRSFISY